MLDLPITLPLLGLAALLIAAVTDLKSRIIPNRIVVAVAIVGVGLQVATRGAGVWVSITAAIAVFLPLAGLAQMDAIGGGDAKLIPAATLLVPPADVISLLVNISLAGGLMSGIYLMARAMRKPGVATLPNNGTSTGEFCAARSDRTLMPYAVAILAGSTASILTEVFSCSSATYCL